MTSDQSSQVLTIKCLIMPTVEQQWLLERIIDQQREIYNSCLEQRITTYSRAVQRVGKANAGKAVPNKFEQGRALTELRAEYPYYRIVQRRIQAATIDKLDRAYQAFFKRAKQGAGGSSGFPKFQRRDDYEDSFKFNAPMQIHWDGRRFRFSGVSGGLRMARHDRARLPSTLSTGKDGNWKGVWFKREGRRWYVGLQIEVPVVHRVGCGRDEIGVDWGTSVLAALSTGETINNQRPGEALDKEYKRAQRRVSRSKKGSRSRQKARDAMRSVARRIANRRKTYLNKVSKRLVTHWQSVAIEDIAVKKMTRSEPRGDVSVGVQRRRNREALDAAPYLLRQMLTYKAVRYGAELHVVPAAGTTQECSSCGATVPKELATMVHACPCGLTLPRKVNAARVIRNRVRRDPGSANGGDGLRCSGNTGGASASSPGPRPRKGAPFMRTRGEMRPSSENRGTSDG